jgi:6-phosphogluconolactonase
MRILAVAYLVACSGDPGSNVKDASMGLSDSQLVDAPYVPTPTNIYVGATGDNTIRVYAMNLQSLTLSAKGSVPTGQGPSFLAFDPMGRWLVAVNEGADALESFAIAQDGTLTKINSQPVGDGPAHVSLDRTGAWALVASYTAGTVDVLPVAANGTLGASVDTKAAGSNAHQIVANAANTMLYVPCKGSDTIASYAFNATTGQLTPQAPTTVPAEADGPRHIAFHPDGNFAFVINELNSTITSYSVGAGGALTAIETQPSLMSAVSGNTGAEIYVHRSGNWLYASNRGDNSIVRYAISATGTLGDLRRVSVFGMTPRHFSLALDDTVMYVAKQDSGSIHAFRVSATDGTLTPVGEMATPAGPQFVGAISQP